MTHEEIATAVGMAQAEKVAHALMDTPKPLPDPKVHTMVKK